jgi:hypothetical protein
MLVVKSAIKENGPGAGVMVGVMDGKGVSAGTNMGVPVEMDVAVLAGKGALVGSGVLAVGEVGEAAAKVGAT